MLQKDDLKFDRVLALVHKVIRCDDVPARFPQPIHSLLIRLKKAQGCFEILVCDTEEASLELVAHAQEDDPRGRRAFHCLVGGCIASKTYGQVDMGGHERCRLGPALRWSRMAVEDLIQPGLELRRRPGIAFPAMGADPDPLGSEIGDHSVPGLPVSL